MEAIMVDKINELLATDYSRDEILDLWEEIMGCYDNLFAAAVQSHGVDMAWFVVESNNSEFVALMEEVEAIVQWQYPDTIS
jgi:hypothetical protein